MAWQIFWNKIKLGSYKLILGGLLNTALIAVFGLIFGFIIGCLIAVVKIVPERKNPFLMILKKIADLYVIIFRGTPMVVQLLIIHFVLFPALGIDFPDLIIGNFVLQGLVIEAIIAFSLNSGAYISEIMRGGIKSVDIGQLEAGRAVGLSYSKAMIKIVIPQAFKNVVPTLGNEFIALIKETSVAGFITVMDLTFAFQTIAGSTYEYLVPYLVLALVYLILVILITLLVRAIEKRLGKAERS